MTLYRGIWCLGLGIRNLMMAKLFFFGQIDEDECLAFPLPS